MKTCLALTSMACPCHACYGGGGAVAGVTVLLTVLKMDAGPIVRQVTYPLNGDEKVGEHPIHCKNPG